jgi:hypothetical protein
MPDEYLEVDGSVVHKEEVDVDMFLTRLEKEGF